MNTRAKVWLVLLLAFTVFPHHSFAWGRKGHEVVAYIAYQNLDDVTRKEVDYLLTLNPCYTQWTQQVAILPATSRPVAVFMLAATWPDLIKQSNYTCQPGFAFTSDGGLTATGRFSPDVPPDTPEASQNIGYMDTRRHQYWHFIDTPFSPDGTPTQPAPAPNSLTEFMLLAQALQSDEANPLKSYDLVWIEHLVGDLHQPLHDVTRYTAQNPHGDSGGNAVAIVQSPNDLHGYWDSLPGSDSLTAAIAMGHLLNTRKRPSVKTLNLDNPDEWVNDGVKLAKTYAYGPPVSAGAVNSKASTLSKSYSDKAAQIVKTQLFLAGQRLAALLKDELS